MEENYSSLIMTLGCLWFQCAKATDQGSSNFPVLNLGLRTRVDLKLFLHLFTPVSLSDRGGGTEKSQRGKLASLPLPKGGSYEAAEDDKWDRSGEVSDSPTMLWRKNIGQKHTVLS